MVFEDILGSYKEDKVDYTSVCPQCGSKDIGTKYISGRPVGFFCAKCKYEWFIESASNV